jgi:hypothetical protein
MECGILEVVQPGVSAQTCTPALRRQRKEDYESRPGLHSEIVSQKKKRKKKTHNRNKKHATNKKWKC